MATLKASSFLHQQDMMMSDLPEFINKASVTFTPQKKGSPFVQINFKCMDPRCMSNVTQVKVRHGNKDPVVVSGRLSDAIAKAHPQCAAACADGKDTPDQGKDQHLRPSLEEEGRAHKLRRLSASFDTATSAVSKLAQENSRLHHELSAVKEELHPAGALGFRHYMQLSRLQLRRLCTT